jgi:MFS family permease
MARALTAGGRDTRVIGLVGVAHLFSHFYQLALPPLFPLIKAETGLSYISLGLIMGAFYATSGILQTPAGFLVDRVGPRPVLFGGLALLATAVAAYGFAPNYETMIAIAMLAGAGNSVFHPADYSLINGAVSRARTGRAYSIHSVGGHCGFAIAPLVMIRLGGLVGWHHALLIAGVTGVAFATLMILLRDMLQPAELAGPHRARERESIASALAVLLQPRIVTFFLFFFTFAFGIIGLQNFAPPALSAEFHLANVTASGVLTAMLIGAPTGVLAGGLLADAVPRHGLIATTGFAAAGALMLLVTLTPLPAPLLFAAFALAGFTLGAALPSRDMVIRAATPPGASGKVFGFVYSGLDVGGSVGPGFLGWLIDIGHPRLVFLTAAALFLAGAVLIRLPGFLFTRRTVPELGS